jgi:hypothetical protein
VRIEPDKGDPAVFLDREAQAQGCHPFEASPCRKTANSRKPQRCKPYSERPPNGWLGFRPEEPPGARAQPHTN